MKKLIFTFILFFTIVCYGQQQGEVLLKWSEKSTLVIGDYKLTIPQFNPDNFQFDAAKKELFFILKTPQSFIVNENALEIKNAVYESITLSELGDLSTSGIPSSINPKIKGIKSRNDFSATITLSPIIKDATGFKKLKSFSYTVSNTPSTARFSQSDNDFNKISNSVLATGEWKRFYIEKSGVYTLTKSFLKQLGISTDGLDPRKIKIYGNGGRMIPLKNSDYYPADLTETAIQVTGEEDGVFNDNDAILFYGEGLDNWNNESKTTLNLYATKSYYYINTQGENGKRMTTMNQPSESASLSITAFDDYQYHEIDKINIVKLGRRWFGEQFDFNNIQSFDFTIPNIVPSSTIDVNIYAAASSFTTTNFEAKANNQKIGTISFSSISEYVLATASDFKTTIPASEKVNIQLTYNNNGVPDSKGYLDYISLKTLRELKGYSKQFRFQYDLASSNIGTGEYIIANANSIKQVWDITDIYNPTKVVNENLSTFSFKSSLGELRKYIAVDDKDYYKPMVESQSMVKNQNLKGTIFKDAQGQFQDIDYLIISPSFLGSQAEKLANFHRNHSGLNVKVVYLENIYQEFSSGKQDIGAIRNFVKYVYNNASSPDKKVKYLNLFGDASYDFKDRIQNNTNIVPIYHALNSYTLGESSYASDDYFGMMDDNEGDLFVNEGAADIALGRMIANTPSQADDLVNKVIDYHDEKSYGNWRNNFVIIADDADKSGDASLQSSLNTLADVIVAQKPFLNADKILLDSYVQETSAGGSRYPKARQDLFNAFEKGSLVCNYLGHGGEDGLAQERIWEKSDGQNLSNKYRYPLFITITCQFSRFDNPSRPTAGEYTYWNPKGGAISMITTVREIGQSTGEAFNYILSKYLFAYGSNQYVSIAEALRLAKNDFGPSTDVVFYLGDPALMLAIPKPQIILTKVNDMPTTSATDVLKSLAYVKLSGEITDENKNPIPTYNGELSVQIFDKMIQRITLGNDGIRKIIGYTPSPDSKPIYGEVIRIPFNTLGETIFRGNATVTNGKFEFGFVVPRDISIPVGSGRVSFYSKQNQLLSDNTGVDNTIKIGGINENAAADNIPPKVKLYMNDQNFVFGGITNQSPFLLVHLEDENGINTASGIGHDIVAILDGDENNPYKLNDYYETELDNYKSGKLKFPFRNLSLGLHTITFKAWDVYNNFVVAEIQFVVVGDDKITLSNVLNYPNPFVSHTEFWFTHNKPYEPLQVQVQVMSIAGKIVWTKNQTITTDGFLSRDITWDGRDQFGAKISKGVYIYKLTVKSLITNTKAEKYEKLVIL